MYLIAQTWLLKAIAHFRDYSIIFFRRENYKHFTLMPYVYTAVVSSQCLYVTKWIPMFELYASFLPKAFIVYINIQLHTLDVLWHERSPGWISIIYQGRFSWCVFKFHIGPIRYTWTIAFTGEYIPPFRRAISINKLP